MTFVVRRVVAVGVIGAGLMGLAGPLGGVAAAAPKFMCDGRPATIVGTNSQDRLVGTPGPDVIVAGLGNDSIVGRGGDDVLCGGGDRDRIVGAAGDDRIFGGADTYSASHAWERIDGDVIVPGPGDDYFDAGWDPRQVSIGAGAPDEIGYTSATRGLDVRLSVSGIGSATGQGRDRIVGQQVLGIVGTKYADRFVGTGADETFEGLSGHDVLLGKGGSDTLDDGDQGSRSEPDRIVAGGGDDHLYSGGGPDRLDAGAGHDQVTLSHQLGACWTAAGGAGQDNMSIQSELPSLSVDARVGSTGCGRFATFESYTLHAEGALKVWGTDGADQVSTDFGESPISADMGAGDDMVVGSNVGDEIDGGPGNDRVEAGAGNDVVWAGEGADEIDGESGRDVCVDAETVLRCESTSYPLPPLDCDGQTPTILVNAVTPATVLGTPGDDVIFGTEGRDTIDGLGGHDVICGSGGADELIGGPGNDRLFGGAGSLEVVDVGAWQYYPDRLVPGPGDDHVDLGWDPYLVDSRYGVGDSPADILDYSDSGAGLTADLSGPIGTLGTVTGEGVDTVVIQQRSVYLGSAHADQILGTPEVDWIQGGAGDDVLDGAGGDDRVFGELDLCCHDPGPADHDVIRGGAGDDTLRSESWQGVASVSGGDGDDSAWVEVRAGLVFTADGGVGDDLLEVRSRYLPSSTRIIVDVPRHELRTSRDALRSPIAGFERYDLYGDVRWTFLGSDLGEAVSADDGRLRAFTGAGDDHATGTDADDHLDLGEGYDTVNAYLGEDTCLNAEKMKGCES